MCQFDSRVDILKGALDNLKSRHLFKVLKDGSHFNMVSACITHSHAIKFKDTCYKRYLHSGTAE